MYLYSDFHINHAIIRNGGAYSLHDDLGGLRANIVTAWNGHDDFHPSIRNTSIENSTEWGIIIAPQTINFNYEDPEKNNTFTNNPSGNVNDLN